MKSMRKVRTWSLVAGLGAAALPLSAWAQTAPTSPPADTPPPAPPVAPAAPAPPAPPAAPAAPSAPAAAPLSAGEKRETPDYDGRGEAPTTVGEGALWVPRVALFPAYLVSEYLVRRPLGFVVTSAEQGRWIQELSDFFTFGPENNIGIVPTALVDFGFRSSVGVYFFYDDFLARQNDLRVHAGYGGEDWLRLTVADRVRLDDDSTVKFRVEAWKRPDGAYYGLGPSSLDAASTHYGAHIYDAGMVFESQTTKTVRIEADFGVRHQDFFDATCCDAPSLAGRIEAGAISAPPGFVDGYTAQRMALSFAYDTRPPRPEPGSGMRLELQAENAIDMDSPTEGRWVRWGGSLGGFVDLTGTARVVGLAVHTQFVEPLADRDVPFTEQAQLGGESILRGFREGRLVDRSLAALTLEYRYPIWSFLDGALDAGVGNVFGDHLEGFSPKRLRFAFDAGMRTANKHRDHSFDFLVGAGTETFEDGAALTELRLVLGARKGF